MARGIAVWSVCAVLPLVALSPTPTPDLNLLSATLADAPDSTWRELAASADTLEGTFDATTYVNNGWDSQSARDDIRTRMVADGFVGGYGRTFYRRSPEAWIIEDVKAFPDSNHAAADLAWFESYFHDPSDSANNIDTSAIPNSFGERYVTVWHGIDIYFQKGNYVFTLTAGSYSDYIPDVARAQASAMYEFAPSRNVLPLMTKPSAAHLTTSSTLMIVGGIAIGTVLIVAVLVIVLYLVVESRRRTPVAMQTVLSPDGKYWWDGVGWQPVPRT